jgi:hypothetical protein
MNASEKQRDEALNAIGREIDDLKFSGRLDFDAFKSLFLRGLEAAGDDTDDLEMFMPVIQDRSWREWMIEQLQRSASRRVA